MAVLRDHLIHLEPGATSASGFFGLYLEDHPDATSPADLAQLDQVLTQPEAKAAPPTGAPPSQAPSATPQTLFSTAPPLAVQDLDREALKRLFEGPGNRHAASVIRTGTASRNSRQIEEDLRRMGAELGSHSGADTSAISVSGLAEFAPQLLELVADLAQNASFPEDEFERERRQRLEELRVERTTPGFLANERFRRVIFGQHPYAIIAPSEEQVASYRREQLVEHYRQHYVPADSLLDHRRRFCHRRDARAGARNFRRLEGAATRGAEVSGAAAPPRPQSASGPPACLRADANHPRQHRDHATRSGLVSRGARQFHLRRRFSFPPGSQYSRAKGLHLQSPQRQ